jgi:protein-tyrosine phosphatase
MRPPYPTSAVIDLHSHILPRLDDGARTIEDSRALARLAAAEGVTAVAATPHVRDDFPTTADQMEKGVAEVSRDFREQGIELDVLHGGEIAFDMAAALDEAELARFTIAQNRRYLLLEFPYSGWPAGLEERVFQLTVRGLVPILAHPERNREVQADPRRLAEAVRIGALVQVTAASVDGRIGKSSRDAAARLLELGLAHVLASDAHTPAIREAGLVAAVEALGDEDLARYLTREAPAAIVAGEPVPHPARRKPRRRFLFR